MAIFTSYDAFVDSTANQQIGDGSAKAYINLIWDHLGSVYYTSAPTDPDPTGQGVKYGWLNTDARAANTISHLTQITSLSDVQRGDIIILTDGANGYAGFANSDYDGTTYLSVCGQGYSISYVTINYISVANFVGGWRYDVWNTPPTPPTPLSTFSSRRNKFPWVLYARKLRGQR